MLLRRPVTKNISGRAGCDQRQARWTAVANEVATTIRISRSVPRRVGKGGAND
jgi:hypothetical protein